MRYVVTAMVFVAVSVVACWFDVLWLAAFLLVAPLLLFSLASVRVIGGELVTRIGPLALSRERLDEVDRVCVGYGIETWGQRGRVVFFGFQTSIATARAALATALPRGVRWSADLVDVSLGRGIRRPTAQLPAAYVPPSISLIVFLVVCALAVACWNAGANGFVWVTLLFIIGVWRNRKSISLEADGGLRVYAWGRERSRLAPAEVHVGAVHTDAVEIDVEGEALWLMPSGFPEGAIVSWLVARGGQITLSEELRMLVGGEAVRAVDEVVGDF